MGLDKTAPRSCRCRTNSIYCCATSLPPLCLHLRHRYKTGLDKLASTELQVQGMQAELEALQPQLLASSAETAELMGVIETQREEADKVKVVVKVRVWGVIGVVSRCVDKVVIETQREGADKVKVVVKVRV